MSTLALLGGRPIRSEPFPAYTVIGDEEKQAAMQVLDSGVLSRFLGVWHPDFFGGPSVQALEREWAAIAGTKHGVSVNSCTSGLYAAVGAVGAGPGDEVIVSPYTMIASATAALIYNAVPVFADIDPVTYTLSAETIAPKITPRTKAIIVVHIFGQSADMDPIMELARASPHQGHRGLRAGAVRHLQGPAGRIARRHRRVQPELPQAHPHRRRRNVHDERRRVWPNGCSSSATMRKRWSARRA